MLRSRRLRLAVLAAVGVAAFAAAPASPATGAGVPAPACEEGSDEHYELWRPVCTEDPHLSGTGGSREWCDYQGPVDPRPVRCVDEVHGWWSHNWQCYLRFTNPQPPPEHPSWRGNDPADGSIYRVTCPWMEGTDGLGWTELAFGWFLPAGSGTLGQIIADAVGRLVLTGPEIRTAPAADGAGLVGLPVWMWTEVNDRAWEPAPLRLPVLGWVLVVEAEVDRIVWEMGNGDTVVCDQGPGTPYEDRHGARQSPDCGYAGYTWPSTSETGGVYELTGTTHWSIEWWFEDQSGAPTALRGDEQSTRMSTAAVRIHELQVVTS